MSRNEFTKATKREAWDRSGEVCEAVGDMYGLPAGERCTADLNFGVEYDHIILDANSKDRSLENCCACCPKCHHWKTNNVDKQTAAKTRNQQDHQRGIQETQWRRPMPGSRKSGFRKRMNGQVERW